MSYSEGLNWLIAHQHPKTLKKDECVTLSHPWSDGDGLATRINRLMRRCIPYILEGNVVILKGGFRGYGCHDPNDNRGFTRFFQPFSRFDYNLQVVAETKLDGDYKNLPETLRKHDHTWWLGVLITYFLRPSKLLNEYIDEKVRYMKLPEDYIGLHIRRGDHPRGLKYKAKDYITILDEKILDLWSKIYPDKKPIVYLATDDKDVIRELNGDNGFYTFLTDNRGIYAIEISHLGQSAANNLIRNSSNKWTIVATLEILSDIILLSNSKYICGLMVSQVTLLSSLIGEVNSKLLNLPFAVDYHDNKYITPDGGHIVKFNEY